MKVASQNGAKQPRSSDLRCLDMSKQVVWSGSGARTVTMVHMQGRSNNVMSQTIAKKACREKAPIKPKRSKQQPTLWERTMCGAQI